MDVKFCSSLQEMVMKNAPSFRGSWIFYTSILKIAPKKLRFCSLVESNIHLDLTDPAQFSIVNTRKGKHEVGTVNFLKKYLSKGDVFIDIGANFGYFSCIASKIVGDEGLVLAFEPNNTAYIQLISTMTRNKLFNCLPVKMALGEHENATMNMKKAWFKQSTSSYMTSGSSVLSNKFDSFSRSLSIAKKVKIIKIDVEGAELPVLKGLAALLLKDKPLLIVEPDNNSQKRFGFKFSELISYLASLGYKPTLFVDPSGDGALIDYKEGLTEVCPVVFMPS